jgi:Flp pilus assembly protein TadB
MKIKVNKIVKRKLKLKPVSVSEKILKALAKQLEKRKLIGSFRKSKLSKELSLCKIEKTPERFYAEIFFTIALILLLLVPVLLTIPLLSPLLPIICIAYYFSAASAPEKKKEKYTKKIEAELPKFSDFIRSSLRDSRDIHSIFKAYLLGAGPALRPELETTIAEIGSSGIEKGLLSFERRMGSKMCSDIIFALLGIVRGDTDSAYFEILSFDIRQKQIAELKMIAKKKPGKMMKYSLMLLFCFIAMYFTVFVIYIIDMTRGLL